MAEITKVALKVDNNTSFPNNNAGAITPAILRAFNVNMIDSMVDEIGYNADSASWNVSISNINAFTASAQSLTTASLLITASAQANSNVITFTKGNGSTFNVTVATGSIPDISNLNQATASLQAFTQSAQISINNLNTTTASLNTSVTNINTFTASTAISITNLNTTTASLLVETQNLELFSASALISISNLNQSSASQQVSIDSINSKTGSFATTGSNTFVSANTFTSISASSFISASQFVGDGSKITNITASIALPILDEGIPQGNAFSMNFTGSAISAIVVGGTAVVSVNVPDTGSFNSLTASFNAYTASTNSSITQLNANTASQQVSIDNLNLYTSSFNINTLVSTASFNSYTSSNNQRVSSLEVNSASVNTSISALNTYTASQSTASLVTSITELNTFSASALVSISNINSTTASLLVETQNLELFSASALISISNINSTTASLNTSVTNLNSATASLFTSASLALVTASFDTGNRNLTFTKGDTTQFSVNIPDVSGSGVPTGTISGSAQITALGFVSSSVTASSLVTASFSGNTLTFTKGDASTFGVVIPDVSGSAGTTVIEVVYTGESITKGDPLYISGSQGANPRVFKADASNPAKMPVTFISNETIGAANTTNAIVLGLIEGIDLTGYTAGQTIYVAEGGGYSINLPSGSNSITQLLGVITKGGSGGKGLVLNPGPAQLPGLDTGYMWVGGATNQPVEITTASFASSASFNTYTSSNDQKVDSLIARTGSYATTGSNVFIGNETFQDAGGNASTLVPTSGSLMLVAKSFTSASAHLSASTSTSVNLIFKNNDNTADTIISGSGNIFVNPLAPTAGFKRYVGGNGNIALLVQNTPQISGSMQFSPTMNSNYFGGNNTSLTMRGPVSSSTYTISGNNVLGTINIGSSAANNAEKLTSGLTMTGNSVGGTLIIVANQSALTGSTTSFTNNIIAGQTTLNLNSSAASMANNIINDSAFTFTNQYYSSSLGLGNVALNRNNIGGQTNSIIISGSLPVGGAQSNSISDNFIFGGNNTIYIDVQNARLSGTAVYKNVVRTGLMGNSLIVSGSSLLADGSSYGSVFVGRYNANDNSRNKTSDVVFAVGTGTSDANRKTGFLIDSGSNSYFEGTLNVSGSTTITGSLILSSSNAIELQVIGNSVFTGSAFGNVISMSIASNTASMDLNTGNYFTLSLPSGSSTRISPTNIQAGTSATLVITTLSGSLVTFDSSVKQPSGSAYVPTSGSIDILSFVSVNSSSLFVVSTLNMI
jgi:hypothetical protein